MASDGFLRLRQALGRGSDASTQVTRAIGHQDDVVLLEEVLQRQAFLQRFHACGREQGGIEILAPQAIEALHRLRNAKDYGRVCQLQSLGPFGEVHVHVDPMHPFLTAARPHCSSRGAYCYRHHIVRKAQKARGLREPPTTLSTSLPLLCAWSNFLQFTLTQSGYSDTNQHFKAHQYYPDRDISLIPYAVKDGI